MTIVIPSYIAARIMGMDRAKIKKLAKEILELPYENGNLGSYINNEEEGLPRHARDMRKDWESYLTKNPSPPFALQKSKKRELALLG